MTGDDTLTFTGKMQDNPTGLMYFNDKTPPTMNDELLAHIAEFEFALKTYGKDNPAKNGAKNS